MALIGIAIGLWDNTAISGGVDNKTVLHNATLLITGVLWLPFALFVAGLCLFQLLAPKPLLIIDRHGIDYHPSRKHQVHMNWEEIERLATYKINGHACVGFWLYAPDAFFDNHPQFKNFARSHPQSRDRPAGFIAVSTIGIRPETCIAAIDHYRRAHHVGEHIAIGLPVQIEMPLPTTDGAR